jgi:hypothetical protein
MPRSKKGRVSGTERQAINSKRAAAAINGTSDGVTFARVTKMLGQGHISVAIPYKHGIKELNARIPNILGRRGATPITVKDVVAIFVGDDYNPDEPSIAGEHFDVVAVLTSKQAVKLRQEGAIPDWMTNDSSTDAAAAGASGNDGGFEFGYDDDEEKKETVSDEETRARHGANRLAQRETADEELNIDDI